MVSSHSPDAPAPIRSVMNALRIIELLSREQPIGVSDLARLAGLPKSSAFRCLSTLEAAGWVAPNHDPRPLWSLTTKSLGVGLSAVPGDELIDVASQEMSTVRDELGDTVHLLVPTEDGLLVVARVDGTSFVRTVVSIGTKAPFHSTSSGRALLSALDEAEARRLLEAEARRSEFDLELELAEVRKARENGYAENDAEWRDGIAGIGVVITSRSGKPLASATISLPQAKYAEVDREEYARHLVEASRRISSKQVR